jgi:hypothetical protein
MAPAPSTENLVSTFGRFKIIAFYCIYFNRRGTRIHRDLMGRLPLHGFYLWRRVLSIVPPLRLWWWKFTMLFDPLPRSSPFIWGQRWQPIQMEHCIRGRGGGRSIDNLLMSDLFGTWFHAQTWTWVCRWSRAVDCRPILWQQDSGWAGFHSCWAALSLPLPPVYVKKIKM